MKKYFIYILLIISSFSFAQNQQLAKKYFEDGDFEKAATEYRLLLDKFPYNTIYLENLIQAYQKAGNFKAVDELVKKKRLNKKPQFMVWLGYNYFLQKDSIRAKKYFEKAINQAVNKNYYVYQTGNAFQKIYRLDEAIELYEKAMKKNPKQNFYLQIAQLYAQKNQPGKMMSNYLRLIEQRPRYEMQIRYYLTPYIKQYSDYSTNETIKKVLIETIKQKPLPAYYRLLEWLYVQQKDYRKAFFQLRSLYKKNEADISQIYQLANTAVANKKPEHARTIYQYLIKQIDEPEYVEKSKLALLKMDTKKILSEEKKQKINTKFQTYLQEKWLMLNHIRLQIQYADFLAFHQNKTDDALNILNDLLSKSLSRRLQAEVQMKKADILMFNGYFNQALILYTQVQLDFPNNQTGHLATYKIARASFFKGDIDWAHNQLKVIKSVHSDLISNDAIDLDLIIVNNKEESDSTQTALKKFAKIKFDIFKKDYQSALQSLDSMKQNYKGQLIYDDVLWTQAQIYEQINRFDDALADYQEILNNKTEDLFVDDAIFRMAKIYENQKDDEEKAKKLYKKIIVEFPASYWFTDAQQAFRRLRGDKKT